MTNPSIFVGNGMGGARVILEGRDGTRNYVQNNPHNNIELLLDHIHCM